MSLTKCTVACGMISQYNVAPAQSYPIRNLGQVIGKRIKMQGFIVSDPDMGPIYHEEHQEKLQKWIAEVRFAPIPVGEKRSAR
jgi:NADPH-dependent curcumin reductase CurA